MTDQTSRELNEAVARWAALPPPEPDPRDAEIERLQRVISQFADCVEKQAFDIPAPCPQTPILVSLAQQARFCIRNPT